MGSVRFWQRHPMTNLLSSGVRNFHRLNPIDRLLAASTVAVVALTILTAVWAVASIRHQLGASSSPHRSGSLVIKAGANHV